MPILTMMVGVPCSGKTTWINKSGLLKDNPFVFSTDNYLEECAKKYGTTYNDCWKTYYNEAEIYNLDGLKKAISEGRNIAWDQTNLTAKSRANKLKMVPDTYQKYCIVLGSTLSMDTILERNRNRDGKFINPKRLEAMKKSYEVPSTEEGFLKIYIMK